MSRRGAILQDYGGTFPEQSHDAEKAAASYYQRDKEQANDLAYKNKQAKQKGQGDSVDFITGLKADHVGDNTIDLHNDAQIQNLQKELTDMQLKGASVNDIKMAAMPKLSKISQGYTIAKNEYAKITEGMKDLSKDYPTGDMEAARNLAGKELLNTIFDKDEKGNIIGYKDPSLIPADKSYLGGLTTNENLPKWYRRSGAYEKGIKDLPLIPIKGGTTRTDARGGKIKQTFTGHGSIFDEPVINDAGEQTGWQLKAEAIPLGRNPDGSIIIEKVMPKEQFNETIATPSAKLDFQSDFNKYLEQTGVNPDKLDPRAKDVLERKFAYDMFEKTGIHGSSFLTTDETRVAPVKNITNNNIRVGAKDVPVMDIVTPVKDYFDKNKEYSAARFNMFNNEVTTPIMNEVKNRYPDITADDIYYKNTADGIWVMKTNEPTVIDDKKDVPVFKLDSFSNVTGNKPQGVKSKNEALRQAQSGGTESKGTTVKKFNIIDPNTGNVIMKDVDEASANKAKEKGYKVQ